MKTKSLVSEALAFSESHDTHFTYNAEKKYFFFYRDGFESERITLGSTHAPEAFEKAKNKIILLTNKNKQL